MREANRNSNSPKFVRRIEVVQKRSIMYYQQQVSQSFLKIVVALPSMVTSCRGMFSFSLIHSYYIFLVKVFSDLVFSFVLWHMLYLSKYQ